MQFDLATPQHRKNGGNRGSLGRCSFKAFHFQAKRLSGVRCRSFQGIQCCVMRHAGRPSPCTPSKKWRRQGVFGSMQLQGFSFSSKTVVRAHHRKDGDDRGSLGRCSSKAFRFQEKRLSGVRCRRFIPTTLCTRSKKGRRQGSLGRCSSKAFHFQAKWLSEVRCRSFRRIQCWVRRCSTPPGG